MTDRADEIAREVLAPIMIGTDVKLPLALKIAAALRAYADEEREACARAVTGYISAKRNPDMRDMRDEIAAAIRARGKP